MNHCVVIEVEFAQEVLRSKSANVGAAAFDRVHADIAAAEKIQLHCIVGWTFKVSFESEESGAAMFGADRAAGGDDLRGLAGLAGFAQNLCAATFCFAQQ